MINKLSEGKEAISDEDLEKLKCSLPELGILLYWVWKPHLVRGSRGDYR